jgi:hypothetical protein
MPDFDPHQWFGDEELEVCPACGERAALWIPTGTLACVACGLIRPLGTMKRVGMMPLFPFRLKARPKIRPPPTFAAIPSSEAPSRSATRLLVIVDLRNSGRLELRTNSRASALDVEAGVLIVAHQSARDCDRLWLS